MSMTPCVQHLLYNVEISCAVELLIETSESLDSRVQGLASLN